VVDGKRDDAGKHLDLSTLSTVPSIRLDKVDRVPALTVAAHPDPTMVGCRAFLSDIDGGRLSRTEPFFEPVRGTAGGGPLADPFVSRKPIELSIAAGGVRILRGKTSSKVAVDATPLAQERLLTAEQVEAGVVIKLARRVVLVLHLQRRLPAEMTLQLGMVGESDALQAVRSQISQVADLHVPVLIRGASGTGKELVARAIHGVGRGAEASPFVAINMAAVPSTMAASALFGHVKGAFTGAHRDHPGHFVSADGGTLFLDEIGDTPADVQAMLLRVLETHEVCPVGGSTSRRVNVRLIAATDAPLEDVVDAGKFRLPLFHRLASYQIALPTLRERREDIGRLLLFLLRAELSAAGLDDCLDVPAQGKDPWLAAWIVERMVQHDWPGNVRQLRNAVRHLVIASRGKPAACIDPTLEAMLQAGTTEVDVDSPQAVEPAPPIAPADLDDDALLEALGKNGWRIGPTAEALGIARSSLYRLIDRSSRIRKAKELSREELVQARDSLGGDVRLMAENLRVSPRGLRLRMKDLGLS